MVPLLGSLANEETDLGLGEAKQVTPVLSRSKCLVPLFSFLPLEFFDQLEFLNKVEVFEALCVDLVLFEQSCVLCRENLVKLLAVITEILLWYVLYVFYKGCIESCRHKTIFLVAWTRKPLLRLLVAGVSIELVLNNSIEQLLSSFLVVNLLLLAMEVITRLSAFVQCLLLECRSLPIKYEDWSDAEEE